MSKTNPTATSENVYFSTQIGFVVSFQAIITKKQHVISLFFNFALRTLIRLIKEN